MKTPDLLNAFRMAAWAAPSDLQRFVREVGALPASDLEKVLEVMGSPEFEQDRRAQDARRQALEAVILAQPSKDHFRPLVRAVPAQSDDTRKVVARLIPRVNDPEKRDELLGLLRNGSPQVRRWAAEVLTQQGGGLPVINALTEMVKEPSFPGRCESMDVLVAVGGARVLPSIVIAMGAGGASDKVHALRHLQDRNLVGQKIPEVLQAIRALFADAADEVVVAALRAFAALCTEDDFFAAAIHGLQSPRLPVVRAVVEVIRRFPVPRAMDALEWRFKAGPTVIRLAILDTLADIQNERVVPLLAEALANPHLVVRRRAADVLARLGQAGRVDIKRTILWLLHNPDVNVRRMAVEMAGGVPDPADELWPELLAYLGDTDWWVRTRLVDALCTLAGRKLLQRLPPAVRGASPIFRVYTIEVLERLGDPDALPVLAALATGDEEELVRERAVEALGRIKHPHAEQALVQILKDKPDLQLGAVDALAELGSRSAAGEVALMLSSPDADVRLAALECLDVMDDSAQARFVEAVDDDVDPQVRKRSADLLERWRTYGASAGELPPDSGLDQLLVRALAHEAEVLILGGGARPLFKKQGRCEPLLDTVLTPEQVNRSIMPLLSAQQRQHFASMEEVDLSYQLRATGRRFRLHVFPQRNGVTAIFQLGRSTMASLESLGLPEAVSRLVDVDNGLILVCGGGGSGKSTTVHALIDRMNRTSMRHIITLEQSLEVVHQPVLSAVTQREIGRHARNLGLALKASMREDPDVIVIDDLKDFEALSFALTAAETGHLVIGALQTMSSQAALERIIKAFPPAQQEGIQGLLAASLRAVLCQKLVPRADGQGRLAACELLLNNSAAANLIRKGKTVQVPSLIATSADAGMITMEADMQRRAKDGLVSPEPARAA